MYPLLILFSASLLGIIAMIGRKFVLLKNGQASLKEEEILSESPFLKEWRHFTVKNVKKYGQASLVIILRFYIRSTNSLKNKYEKIKIRVKNIAKKRNDGHLPEKIEVSKFLKIISEYKRKIREIKHQIKEEEKENL